MSAGLRHLLKEGGTAFAVLAIYLLTLLAPLHQAAGLQRDLAALGYQTIGEWTLCVAPADAGSSSDMPTGAKCPATGIGKFELAVVVPTAPGFEPTPTSLPTFWQVPVGPLPARNLPPHIGQSRAPPVSV